ncbi:glutathione S-transferase family protein [Gammaproteobacteria bacterium]|nr:glutathione S-transferase family protein [Gammaproteobacteria bacterium]
MKLLRSDIKTREILDWKGVHLLNYQFSACSMKTRIYLNLKKIPFTSHQINLSAGENFSEWFQGINPRSLVPVLIHDGEVHIESNDILEYLEGCFKESPLIPENMEEKVKELLKFEDNLHVDIRNITFKFLVPRFLNKGKSVQPKAKNKATLNGELDSMDDVNRNFWEHYEKYGITDEDASRSLIRFRTALEDLNDQLEDSPYILGAELSLVDIAWFIYATRIQHANYPLQRLHPNVSGWYERLYANVLFRKEVRRPLIMQFVLYVHSLILRLKGRSIEDFLLDQ